MNVTIELTGWQQIRFCIACVPWGVLIGGLFDVNSGMIRASRKKMTILLLDGVFGPVAACITFFCALVVMDGQIHPLLLFGILSGFLLEHYTLGRILVRVSQRSVVCVHRCYRFCRGVVGHIGRIFTVLSDKWRVLTDKNPAKSHKIHKNR